MRHGKRVFGVDIPAVGVPILMDGAGPRTLLESRAKEPDENLLLVDQRRASQVVACTLHDMLAG
jgi:hypothetical protein